MCEIFTSLIIQLISTDCVNEHFRFIYIPLQLKDTYCRVDVFMVANESPRAPDFIDQPNTTRRILCIHPQRQKTEWLTTWHGSVVNYPNSICILLQLFLGLISCSGAHSPTRPASCHQLSHSILAYLFNSTVSSNCMCVCVCVHLPAPSE